MGKMLALLLILLLALASMTSYLVLTEKITSGTIKITEGQQQLADGQKLLAQGKARLANGKQRLSGVKNVYNGISAVPLVGLAEKLPISGQIFGIAKGKITEGNALIAKGNEKIKNGEKQLEEGKQDLAHGMNRLHHAKGIRNLCIAGTVFFTALLLVLGFCWRETLTKVFYKRR